MATYGSIGRFIPENETIAAYLERAQVFMDTNGIADGKKVSVLLSVVGGKTYSLLCSLFTPDKPQSKSFATIVKTLEDHSETKLNVIAERFHFYRRSKMPSESVAEFVAELKRLATHCAFGDNFNEALRDRLVCGLRNQGTQKRLLSEQDLTFQKAIDIARGVESAEKTTQQLKDPVAAIQPLRQSQQPTAPEARSGQQGACHCCGDKGHHGGICRFRDVVCHKCRK